MYKRGYDPLTPGRDYSWGRPETDCRLRRPLTPTRVPPHHRRTTRPQAAQSLVVAWVAMETEGGVEYGARPGVPLIGSRSSAHLSPLLAPSIIRARASKVPTWCSTYTYTPFDLTGALAPTIGEHASRPGPGLPPALFNISACILNITYTCYVLSLTRGRGLVSNMYYG